MRAAFLVKRLDADTIRISLANGSHEWTADMVRDADQVAATLLETAFLKVGTVGKTPGSRLYVRGSK